MSDQKITLLLLPGEQQLQKFTTSVTGQKDAGLLYVTNFRILWCRVNESPTINYKFSDITSKHLDLLEFNERDQVLKTNSNSISDQFVSKRNPAKPSQPLLKLARQIDNKEVFSVVFTFLSAESADKAWGDSDKATELITALINQYKIKPATPAPEPEKVSENSFVKNTRLQDS